MVEQSIVSYKEMADFLDDHRKKKIDINILTIQPFKFEKTETGLDSIGGWRVTEYLWVYIPIQMQPVGAGRAGSSPIIIPQRKVN